MPSPTASTWPPSVTSASEPKFSICCLRMAEISAARMSIYGTSCSGWGMRGEALAGLAHRETDGVELGAQAGVDHAVAEPHDQPADQRRVDPHVEVDLGLGDLAQRRLDVAEHLVGG